LAKLRTVTERYAELRPEVRFFTFAEGVWSTPDILGFDSRGSSASTVVEEGAAVDNAVQVPVTSLDVALGGAAPNYIKMDVEGAERQALEGSREIIKRYKPVLAICVYHKPADLWELPLFIHEICPDYKMYLRLHSHMGTSAVLYCVAP
jgi:FkbM family methyltransferase